MTAVVTFVSSVKAATAGTTCKGKVDTQMLSEPHYQGPLSPINVELFSRKKRQAKPIRHSERSGQIIP